MKRASGTNAILRLVLPITVITIVVEFTIMVVVESWNFDFPPIVVSFLDAAILGGIAAPTFYYLIIKPFIVQINSAARRIEEQELILNQAQSVANMGIWHLTYSNNHLEWSDEIFRIFGIDPQRFNASLEAFYDLIHPDDLIGVQDAFSASLSGEGEYDIEHRLIQKDTGAIRWVHERCAHEYDSSGNIYRSVGIVQDITDRKVAEEKIRQTEAELLERANTLEHTNLLLEEQAKELEQLTTQLVDAKESAEVLSITDPLTGLFNRLKLDQVFDEELERFQRFGTLFSVILLDLDYFKRVNDNYGHLVGDKVLIAVSNMLSKHCRQIDTIGRWGGEEFLIICPGTDESGALLLAEKIRQQVSALPLPMADQITASLGVSQCNNGDNKDRLTNRVDQALYNAKRNGRNRVECFNLSLDDAEEL